MWNQLEWQAWATLGVTLLMMVALIRELARPDMIFLSALGLLLAGGILSPDEAFLGFANPAVITVGSLFVVAVGVENTGALSFVDRLLFTKRASFTNVLLRLMVTTAGMSAFLNNTPIVAMLIPRVQAWSEQNHVPASKLLIPLSYAAILGGTITLMGTSTNLLVSGLMQSYGYAGLGLFDLAWVGLPATLLAIGYLSLIGYRLLPDRGPGKAAALEEDQANYLFEVRVGPTAPLIGQTIEQADLRALREVYLVHLYRNGEIIPSSPETLLRAGDVLTFLGQVSMVDKLLERTGFERVTAGIEAEGRSTLPLYEAVVASSSRLVGRTLRETDFREQFQGIVLGIQRQDAPIEGPLANVPLKAGDLLLIEAPTGFDKRWNGRLNDFYLVASRRLGSLKTQPAKAPIALAILLGVVIVAALDFAPIVVTAFVGALAMLVTRCLRGWEARRAVDFPVLVVIAAALGIGQAIQKTGLADAIAHSIIQQAAVFGPVGVLIALYVATSLLTEMITNNAAAALMLSIGLATARDLSVAPEAFAIAIAIAASASFLTPIGYQTNLMVMSAGGYRFSDYTKVGFPVTLIVGTTAIGVISLLWL